MRLLITGATGFIGKELISAIKHDPFRVVVREKNNLFIDQLVCDFRYSSIDIDALNDIHTVIHLAGLSHNKAESNSVSYEVNCNAVIRLARQCAAAGVQRFVFISTILVLGDSTKNYNFSYSSSPIPITPFSRSKYDAELALTNIAKDTGIEVVIIRPTLVYGREAPGNFGLLTSFINKVPFLPFGLTNNLRDFISVKNLVDLILICSKHPDAAGNIFLASDGETVSIKDFTNAIAKGLNKKLIQLPVPVSLMRLAARVVGKQEMAEQLLGDLQVDSSNAQDVLGWVPPYTMEQAMASLSENKK